MTNASDSNVPAGQALSELKQRLFNAGTVAFLIDCFQARVIWANRAGRAAWGLSAASAGSEAAAGWLLDRAMPAVGRLSRLAGGTGWRAGPPVASASTGDPEPLVFWTPRGVLRLDCSCQPRPDAGAGVFLITDTAPTTADLPTPAQEVDQEHSSCYVDFRTRKHGLQPGSGRPRPLILVADQSTDFSAGNVAATPTSGSAVGIEKTAGGITVGRSPVVSSALASSAKRHASPAPHPTGNDTDIITLREIARRIREGRNKSADDSTVAAPPPAVANPHRRPFNSNPQQSNNGRSRARSTPPALPNAPSHSLPDSAKIIPIGTSRPPADNAAARYRTDRRPPAHQPADPATMEAAPRQLPADIPADTIAKLAHELRTPIGAIHAIAEIIDDERFGPLNHPRYQDYVGDIREAAAHALSVINNMLAQPREDAGEPAYDFVELDLGDLVQRTVSSFRPLAEKAGIAIHLKSAPYQPLVIADARSVRQMLLNLLTNALKFTAPNGSITVSTDYKMDGPMWLDVRDTGCGMSADVVERIANAGSDESKARPTASGTGLGLPLTNAMAGANGASLHIASTPGRGTCVRIEFGPDRIVPR